MAHYYLRGLTIIAGITMMATSVQAQIVDCNTFLKGNSVEIGINENGAYGSSVQAPAGYHANVVDSMYVPCTGSSGPLQNLGLVADPAQDGWSTGTPGYYGDFLMPGNPREGWAISDQHGMGTAYAHYYNLGYDGFTGGLTGANVSYNTVGSRRTAVWEGLFSSGDMTIKQTTTIDTANLYFTVKISLRNIGSGIIDSVYYLRSLNAHNDEVLSGNMNTLNLIEHQLPDPDSLTVVSAKGTVHRNAYLGLGTRDLRAKAFIIRASRVPVPGTLASIYAEDPTNYMYADSVEANTGIGLIFNIGRLGPGEGADIDFAFTFSFGVIDTVVIPAEILIPTLHTTTTTAPASIAIYPNPAKDLIYVQGMTATDKVAVYDLLGRMLISEASQSTVSLTGIPAGSYLVTVRNESGQVKARIPVQKL